MSIDLSRKRRLAMTVAALISFTAVLGLAGPAQAAYPDPPGGPKTGCPSGAVCIYPGASWNGGEPSHVYFSYGAHKFYDQYGKHRVYNNQYGGARAKLCKGSNGTSCGTPFLPQQYRDVWLDYMNSVKLYR